MNKENLGLSTEDCQKFQEIFKALEEGKEIEFRPAPTGSLFVSDFAYIGTVHSSDQFRVKHEPKYSYFASYEDQYGSVLISDNFDLQEHLDALLNRDIERSEIKRIIKKYKLNEQTGEIV